MERTKRLYTGPRQKIICTACSTVKPIKAFEIRKDIGLVRGVCKACRNDQTRGATAERNKKLYADRMGEARRLLGEKCALCGSTDRMEIDHINPKTKVANMAGLWQNKQLFFKELKKCQLLCHEHHWDKTVAERGHQRRTLR